MKIVIEYAFHETRSTYDWESRVARPLEQALDFLKERPRLSGDAKALVDDDGDKIGIVRVE